MRKQPLLYVELPRIVCSGIDPGDTKPPSYLLVLLSPDYNNRTNEPVPKLGYAESSLVTSAVLANHGKESEDIRPA